MRKDIDSYIDCITMDNARYIIVGGYCSIADYLLNSVVSNNDLREFFDDKEVGCGNITDDMAEEVKGYINANYNYLPFDYYFKYYLQTACRFVDKNGNNEVFAVCDTDDIIEDFMNENCTCTLLEADDVFKQNSEQWLDVLQEANIDGICENVLKVETSKGTHYIALYDALLN